MRTFEIQQLPKTNRERAGFPKADIQEPAKKKWWWYVQEYFEDYFEKTSVHGFQHLMVTTRHPVEIALWLVVIVASAAFSVLLCNSSWHRYNENPTVVSMEKDYRKWRVDFPAATICYHNRINESKAIEYINKTWGEFNTTKADYYMKFLNELTNISYNNLDKFEQFAQDEKLAKLNLDEVSVEIQGERVHNMKHNSKFVLNEATVFTEFGLCYTGQSAIAHHFNIEPAGPSIKQPRFIPHTICDPATFCRTQYEYGGSFIYAVHSPFEMININTAMIHPPKYWLIETNFKYLYAVASDSLRRLTPAQRGCNFADEAEEIGLPLYSYNLCQAVCRKRAIEKLCGCLPLFYAKMGYGRFCNLRGLVCASRLARSMQKRSCSCRPLCEAVYFTKDRDLVIIPRNSTTTTNSVSASFIINPTSTTWHVLYVTKFRLVRDVVFSFADLLVSFGGTAGLFLGCSLLSGVEVLYFFTLRLFFHVYKKYRRSH